MLHANAPRVSSVRIFTETLFDLSTVMRENICFFTVLIFYILSLPAFSPVLKFDIPALIYFLYVFYEVPKL